MMGLFGTVTGMFVTFSTTPTRAIRQPGDLAGGIKMALITTIFGLTVAIPAGVAFYTLRRVIKTSTEINAITEDLSSASAASERRQSVLA
jgi:biopolymer transport protein ExbB